jgi:glycosyltransferase involved in cell wall biosynthesis
MNCRLNVLSISIEYPNPCEPGKGLFVRARLQAMAKLINLKVLAPVALLDYANPDNRVLGPRDLPRSLDDGAAQVFYPRWIYPPHGGFVNAFFLFFRLLWPLRRFKRLLQMDVLDSHFVHPDGIAAALAAWILRKPFIVTARGSEIRHEQFRMRKFWMGWALRRASRVIAVSDNLREFALRLGVQPKRVKVIPNGIDSDVFFPRDRMLCRATHDISQGAMVILSAGDLAEIKGHHRVIRALEFLRGSGVSAELIIAGGIGRSGRYAEVLRSEVAHRGLEGHVRFLGEVRQPQLAELMSAADVFCLASSREGCPNVVTEALACGTPVVATNVGAVPRLVPTEQYGHVVPVNEPEALVCALRDGLRRTWDRASIAAWGGARSWGQVADEVVTEIRQVAAEASWSKHPKSIIVNADDLGKTRETNDAIFELMARNRVSSATIMANGPAFEHAIRGLRQLRDRSFGIHLNLTEFEPLSHEPGARLLTDPNGLLYRGIVQAGWKPGLLRAIYAELCAQVDHLLASGVSISHVDSHHHVHTLPFIFPVIKAIQRRYHVRKIRISKNIYTEQTPCSATLRAKKLFYNWALRADSDTTEGFTDLSSFCDVAHRRTIPQRTIEIMVHPGAPGSETETALLRSPWEEALPFEVEHLNYDQFSRKA